jgi:hypothetical protein
VSERLKAPEQTIIPPKGVELDTAFGPVARIEPGITYSLTPAHWTVPGGKVIVPRGASPLRWENN